jgi:uncharacterized protein
VRRDRDPAGRPRNARARDTLGRPLPRTTQPGPDQSGTDQPQIPENLPPADAVRLADELLRTGRPFHAHEVLENSWKSGSATERDLWQGLAQIAVGLTHAHRGNARGAITLLRRGGERARAYQGGDQYGIDLDKVLAAAEALANQIEQEGLDAIPAGQLRPGLTAEP